MGGNWVRGPADSVVLSDGLKVTVSESVTKLELEIGSHRTVFETIQQMCCSQVEPLEEPFYSQENYC